MDIESLVTRRFELCRELAELDENIKCEVVRQFSQHQVGERLDHDWYGGGKFEITGHTMRATYHEKGRFHWVKGDTAIFDLRYVGHPVKKDGGLSSRAVDRRQDVPNVVLGVGK